MSAAVSTRRPYGVAHVCRVRGVPRAGICRSRRAVAPSTPTFVRASKGDGCAERFIRTLKENLLWVRIFRPVEELRLALHDVRRTYNEHWLIERRGHRSPTQFRRDRMDGISLAAYSQSGAPRSRGGTLAAFQAGRS